MDINQEKFIKNPSQYGGTSKKVNELKASEPKIVMLSEGEKATLNMPQQAK